MKIQFGTYIEFVSALVALACFVLNKNFINKNLLWFLWLTVAVEFVSALPSFAGRNAFLFNLFNPVEIIFFFLLLRKAHTLAFVKPNYLWYGIIVYFFFFIINICFFQGFFNYNSYTVSVGTIFIVYSLFIFVSNWMRISIEKQHELIPLLWIISGMAIFNIGSFSYVQALGFITPNITNKQRFIFHVIYNSLNTIEYLFCVVGLIYDFLKNNRMTMYHIDEIN